MAYTIPQKALELAHEAADKLKLRFSGKVVTEGFDTDGLPTITINDGTPATTEMNIFVKINLQSWSTAKDILGNAANIYAPLTVQIVTEAPASGAGIGVYLSVQNALDIAGELILRGSRVEWYQSANGTVPVAASITSVNLKAAFQPDLYNPLTSQQ